MTETGGYRGLNFSRPFMGERAPQHVQNLVIRDYAARNGLAFKLSATEYAMPGSHMMLATILKELDTLDGIILYSLFQLPEDAKARRAVYAEVLERGKSLHAALENLAVRTETDARRVEDIWRTRQCLDGCPSLSVVASAWSHGEYL